MPRRTQKDAEQTRKRILVSALALFAEKGYEKTTFDDIAKKLEMTKGAVYWHFESKQALLLEIVRGMQVRFASVILKNRAPETLTFASVREMMVDAAVGLVANASATRFYMLMQTQIRWGDESMRSVREKLMNAPTCGPMNAFRKMLANEKAAGRVRADVDVEAQASILMALWDGLTRSAIDHFLRNDLRRTLEVAFDGVWEAIRTR